MGTGPTPQFFFSRISVGNSSRIGIPSSSSLQFLGCFSSILTIPLLYLKPSLVTFDQADPAGMAPSHVDFTLKPDRHSRSG